MAVPLLHHMRPLRPSRLLKRVLTAGIVLLLLLAGLAAALPTLLSTAAAQGALRQRLSRTLQRPVTWTALTASWRHGLQLTGLSLGDGPAPLLGGAVADVTVSPRLTFPGGRPRLDLTLQVSDVALRLAPGPPPPPKPFKEPLTALADAIQRLQALDLPLPVDLGVQVAVAPVRLQFRDPRSGRRLELEHGSLRVDLPSLADRPVAVALGGDLAVDGRRLDGLSLTAGVRHLVTSGRRIRPAAAHLEIAATLPGTRLAAAGGLQEADGLRARLRLDLPRLATAAGPLLPPATPQLRGDMDLILHAAVDPARDLRARLQLAGTGLALAGGRLGGRSVGPLDLRLQQQVASDHRRQQVRFTDGSLTIGTLLAAEWQATVDRPARTDRDLAATLGTVRLDLKQTLALAAPFLKQPPPVTDLTGTLGLQRLAATLRGDKRGTVTLDGLTLELPRLQLARQQGNVTAAGITAALERLELPLDQMRPTRADARLVWSVDRCAVAGTAPLALEGLKGTLQAAVTDLKLDSPSPRKVAARLDLRQSLELARVNRGAALAVDNLHQQLAVQLEAKESGEVAVTLPELKLTAAAVRARANGRQLPPLPLSVTLAAAGIRLPATGGAPTVERATATAAAGDALRLAASASLSGAPGRRAASDGTLRADLDRLLPLASPFLPKGAAAGGTVALGWDLAAPAALQPPAKDKNPLRAARAALALLERGDVTLDLAGRNIRWPLPDGTVRLDSLATSRPLRLALPARGGSIRLGGELAFAGLGGLPGGAAALPPQGGTIALDGELAGWQSLTLRQQLQVAPLGLSLRSDLAAGRLVGLLEQDRLDTKTLLQRLDATLTADLAARFPATPAPLPGGMAVAGNGSARVRLDLAGGRNLRLQFTGAARDLSLRLKNGTAVDGVTADLLLERDYALARGTETGWSPLSASLVRPLPAPVTGAGAAELAGRVREDLRGQERGSRRFTIRRVVVPGKVPLELSALEGDLLLTPEETGLSFFQTEALGGTVRLRGMLDLRPELPALAAACSFSNLDADRLLPAEVRQRSRAGDAAVTGELSLDAPLATAQRELLEGLRLRLNLRRIGRETLERALFSLDPYERNEQVVAQRKLLRSGTLNWLRAGTRDGSFGLEGEVRVKGVTVTLPPVERIRLADLPLQKQLATTLAGMKKLRAALELVRADTLTTGPDGTISLSRRNHE